METRRNEDIGSNFGRVSTVTKSRTYIDSGTSTLSTGAAVNNDGTITLTKDPTNKNQIVENVKVTLGIGGTSNATIIIYDGTGGASTSTALTGTANIAALPIDGLPLRKKITSGKLGWRIANLLVGTGTTAYVNVIYSHSDSG